MKRFYQSSLSSFKKLSDKFKDNCSGSIVPFTALGLSAIMLSAGVALDYSRLSQAKTVMSNSVDAALLSAARELSRGETNDAKLKKNFEDFFLANLEGRSLKVTNVKIVNFDKNDITGKVNAEVNADLDMTFMAIAGYDKVTIPVKSNAVYQAAPVEVSMVLDVTGSMSWDIADDDSGLKRITALKGAAQNAVNKLLADVIGDRVTIGLVPYSASVNVGSLSVLAGGAASTNGCVVGRLEREYTAESFMMYPLQQGPTGNDCPQSQIVPLTNDKTTLLSAITNLETGGYTAGHEGIAWGHYLLSKEVGIWSNPSLPRPKTANVEKIVILMTDGEFNTYYADGTGHSDETVGGAKSRFSSKKMCQEMKDSNITIYSIAFGSSAPDDPLLQCASTDEDGNKLFYKALTASDLDNAFDNIASKIKGLYLSS